MYNIGTLVLYDRAGVYKVESIGTPPIEGTKGDYYKLCAVFSSSSDVIYTPVSASLSTRPLISSGEALGYLKSFAGLEPNVSRSGKTADLTARYRSMLASRRVEDYLRLIKEIHIRQREMAQSKKRLGQVDSQYLKLAEKLVCEEFAAVLNTTPELILQRLYAAE